MTIQPFTLGFGYTNSYVAYTEDKDAYIIDAPNSIGRLIEFIEKNELRAKAVLLTHGHYDHILGLSELRTAFKDIDIFISLEDSTYLENGGEENIALLGKRSETVRRYKSLFDSLPSDFKIYSNTVGPFKVLKTPGHTHGSVSLYSAKDKVLFSGDTLFYSGVGRWDLGGDYSSLANSLSLLIQLPDDTQVFPGHGSCTSIAHERKENPYL